MPTPPHEQTPHPEEPTVPRARTAQAIAPQTARKAHTGAVCAVTPLPGGRVASGGELSRSMLACRSVMADLDDVPTLVFDEVDAGIGGRAGLAVGRRLARLARTRQVLVVTHLPQIACFADRHIRVRKREGTATVSVLDPAERVAEISRMLSGLPHDRRNGRRAQTSGSGWYPETE